MNHEQKKIRHLVTYFLSKWMVQYYALDLTSSTNVLAGLNEGIL
jgi:hypothetical protein